MHLWMNRFQTHLNRADLPLGSRIPCWSKRSSSSRGSWTYFYSFAYRKIFFCRLLCYRRLAIDKAIRIFNAAPRKMSSEERISHRRKSFNHKFCLLSVDLFSSRYLEKVEPTYLIKAIWSSSIFNFSFIISHLYYHWRTVTFTFEYRLPDSFY